MKKLQASFLAICMLLISVCAFAQTWSNEMAGTTYPIKYVGTTGASLQYMPIGCTNTFQVIGNDTDWYGLTPYYQELTASITSSTGWLTTAHLVSNRDCRMTLSKTANSPEYDNLTQAGYSIDDLGDGWNDTALTGTTNFGVLYWFGPTGDIQGPSSYCLNASVSYCVPVGPTQFNDTTGVKHYWYVTTGAQPTPADCIGAGSYSGGFSSITMPSKPHGTYKIWVRAEDRDHTQVSPWSLAKSKDITVNELPTKKPACSGGSSCGSGGGDSAAVDPKTGDVFVGSSIVSMVGPHARMMSLDDASETKKCSGISEIKLFLYESCNGTKIMHLHVYTSCGDVYCLNAGNFNPVASLPNGETLQKEDLGNDTYRFTWSAPGGSYEKHLTTTSSDWIYEIRDENGNVTTGTLAGSVYTYTDSPAGGTSPTSHKYTVIAGNLTHYEAVNVNNSVITSTDLAYDDPYDSNKVTGITLNTPNELAKVRNMSYDSSGNLTSVSQNGKITRYTRTTDAQGRLKVTVTIEDDQATLYGKTEYLFDTYTTTVTAKDAQNLLPDQDTIYHYMTDSSGNKRYLFMVENPAQYASDTARDTTMTKIYAPAGYYTEFGETSATANANYCVADTHSYLWGKPITVTQIVGPTPTPPLTRATRIVQSYDTYDSFGNATLISYPTVKKGVWGSPITETDFTPSTSFTYNSSNQLTDNTDLDGSSTHYTYDATSKRLTGETRTASDGVTVATTYVYNTNGSTFSKQVVTSNPSSTWLMEYTYNSNGLLQTETLKNGSGVIQSSKTYDYLQGGVVQPGPTSIVTVYNNPNGSMFRTTTESSTYDIYGNLASRTDANNRTVSYSKTATSTQKTERVIYASGVYSETVSDCCKVLYSTGIDGKVTNYVYDPIGRVVKTYTNDTGQSETAPLVQNTYDGFGRNKTVTTRSNASTARTTSYTYDILNRVTTIDNPGTLADELMYYDVYGNLLAKAHGTGQTSIYGYDAMNRVINTWHYWTRPTTIAVPTTTPDMHNIYVLATSALMAENTVKYSTNGLGQLTGVYWYLTGRTTSYTYDTMGRKSSVTHDGNTTNYTYDPMGNLATIKLGTSTVASYTTDAVGNRTRVDFGNGTWQEFSYGSDARYMLSGIDYAYKCDANDTLSNKGGIRVTRTNGGNPLSWADDTDKFIKTFSYDNQGRLANADIPGVSRTDYGYDWVGNRTSPTAVYNTADQLTSYSGNTYTYWDDGGMNTGAGRTFGYSSNGDPYQVSYNGNNKNGKFDTHGLREVSYGASTIKYCYDITASTPALISEGPNDGTTTYYYVREPSGALVMRKNGTDLKYYHFDELGSTLFLTDASGVQTDKYVYNAWGKVVSSSGSTVNPYRYIGRYGYYYDTETDLYLLGKRYYDADAGVFCQRDPAKDGLSYYAYTSGKVMTAVDPWGLWGNIGIPPYELFSTMFRWYFIGGGADFILEQQEPNRYAQFWGSSQVSKAIRKFKTDQQVQIAKKAKSICKNSRRGAIQGTFPVDIATKSGYSMDVTHVPGLWAIGQTTIKPQGSSCQLSINCCQKSVNYACNTVMMLDDTFIDVADIHNQKPGNQELIGGTAFRIRSYNTVEIGGDTSWQ